MNTRFFILKAAFLLGSSSFAADWLHLPAKEGTANGKKIVLVSGDEEYRSEETCPMLAKILSQKHGFDCTVLFAINPEGGHVDPNYQKNIPGLDALEKADLMIIGTRFRQLPDDQIAHFANYLNAGKPVIGFRTATHGFTGPAKTGDFEWKKFGLKILGEEWVSHHGKHRIQGARGVVEAANSSHEVLQGVGEIFGPSDVYGVKNLDQKAATILLRGAVTESLTPDSKNVEGGQNKPMMPAAWLREYTAPNGSTKGTAFCTTFGASTDFADEDLRRLIVNASFHLTGLKVPAKADVKFIDAFKPTDYLVIKDNEHYKKLNLKPESYAIGKSPSTGWPANITVVAVDPDNNPNNAPANATHAKMPIPRKATSVRPQEVAAPSKGERIVFIGNGLAERDVYYGQLETELHLRYPEQNLFVRNMGRVGDTPGFRPHPARKSQWAFPGAAKFNPGLTAHEGEGFFPTPDQWLTDLSADTIVAFFGYNESFGGPLRLADFEGELDAFVQHTLTKAYNGKAAPRLVLASPIAFENLSAKRDLPTGEKENANLALYTAAMEKVATKYKITFVNLFEKTKARYAKGGPAFTINGFAPTDAGYKELGTMLADAVYGPQAHQSKADSKLLNKAVKDKDWFWNNDYNLINGVHTHGRRYAPYGPQNYQDEVKKTREMMAIRDELIYGISNGSKTDLKVDDSKTHVLPPVPTNYGKKLAPGEKETFPTGEEGIKQMTMLNGYKVELFASEKEFPNMAKPMQMSFDNKGRLWIATMPSYPHYRPGDALPDDKILIYEDTNNDGKADKETVFAEKLHLPIGFELTPEGVYISQEPNLCLLVDDNKDDKADRMEIIMHGFDTHDTHHAISAYTTDASGAIYLNEGRFLHSQVETPYGPRRCTDGGVWRFDPNSYRLERYVQTDVSNPWGYAFDRWEQGFLADASDGENWWTLPISAKMPYGIEINKSETFTQKRSRPTSGSEFVSSRHFPDEHQDHYMVCNAIGFLGISLSKIEEQESGFSGKLVGDLISSADGNFRPVDLEFAPDGSLYFIDWYNPLIGHMQHNVRDPNRDKQHGRVYRITYPSRPLVTPAKIAGASISELLENLKTPEYRTRYRTRRELRSRPAAEVIPAVKAWAAALDKADPNYEHHLCEAMWATWSQNQPDAQLIEQCLGATQHQARAAAAEVLRNSYRKIPNALTLLNKIVNDPHGRVRLQGIITASWLDNADGARLILEALKHPLDKWMGPVTKQILGTTLKDDIVALKLSGSLDLTGNPNAEGWLNGSFRIADGKPRVKDHGPTNKQLSAEEIKIYQLGKEVYRRDAHCSTCHQVDGKGTPKIYPPLAKSEWLDDDDRFIKIILKGIYGKIHVAGEEYDPSKGIPPMMGFGGLLKDEEVAAVASYVRQSFGNDAKFITPDQVKKVREETKDRANFYTPEELEKEHPIKKK